MVGPVLASAGHICKNCSLHVSQWSWQGYDENLYCANCSCR